MTPLEQLEAWANEGYNVTLHINDGHETELGKPSYCLFLSNDEGEWEDYNDIHGSIEEAVEAIKSAPFTSWEDFKRVDPDNFTCELPETAERYQLNEEGDLIDMDSGGDKIR
jgi:hypothetical protein